MRRMKRKFRRYMDRNWGYILIGLWFTSKAIESAYGARGYRAFGSEFLVLPAFLFSIEMLRKLIKFVRTDRRDGDVRNLQTDTM